MVEGEAGDEWTPAKEAEGWRLYQGASANAACRIQLDQDVAWRLMLCGAGFGLFQAPNNRILIGSAPPERAGAGSGMLSTSRLVGQTTGSALVAVVFGLTHGMDGAITLGTHLAMGMAAGFAGLAMILSWMRLRT